jgi:hypothetical protein
MFLTIRHISKIYGPIYKNSILSHDNIDPISLEKIWILKDNIKINVCEIPSYLKFSYIDENNNVRLFNILSLLKISNFDKKDPTTRQNININIFNNISDRINFMKKHNLWNEILVKSDNESQERKISNLITEITSFLAHYNIHINNNLISKLSPFKLKQLNNECKLILYHRDNVEFSNKLNKLYFNTAIEFKPITLYYDIVNIINFINNENLNQYKATYAYILLGALMYVSPNINNIYNSSVDLTN